MTSPQDLIRVRPIVPADRVWVAAEYTRHFGSDQIDSHDEPFDTRTLPGFVAECDGQVVAALSHTPLSAGRPCEVIALASRQPGRGAGTALLAACIAAARNAGCSRIFLTTSNDNTPALRFYQKRGWRVVTVHRDAITRARLRQPTIPLTGHDGIIIADEIELEFAL